MRRSEQPSSNAHCSSQQGEAGQRAGRAETQFTRQSPIASCQLPPAADKKTCVGWCVWCVVCGWIWIAFSAVEYSTQSLSLCPTYAH